jgi:hypothetical protein
VPATVGLLTFEAVILPLKNISCFCIEICTSEANLLAASFNHLYFLQLKCLQCSGRIV